MRIHLCQLYSVYPDAVLFMRPSMLLKCLAYIIGLMSSMFLFVMNTFIPRRYLIIAWRVKSTVNEFPMARGSNGSKMTSLGEYSSTRFLKLLTIMMLLCSNPGNLSSS